MPQLLINYILHPRKCSSSQYVFIFIFVTGVPTRITLSCVYIYLPSKFEFLVELCIREMFCVLLRYTKWFWAGTRYRPLQTCCWWSNEATKTRLAVYSLGPMRDNWSALTRGNAVDSQSQGRTLSLKMPRSQHWEEECAAKYSVRVSAEECEHNYDRGMEILLRIFQG